MASDCAVPAVPTCSKLPTAERRSPTSELDPKIGVQPCLREAQAIAVEGDRSRYVCDGIHCEGDVFDRHPGPFAGRILVSRVAQANQLVDRRVVTLVAKPLRKLAGNAVVDQPDEFLGRRIVTKGA